MSKKIDTKYIIIFIVLLVTSFIVADNKKEALDLIKYFLLLKPLELILTLLFFCLSILYKVKYNNYSKIKIIEFNDFKTIAIDLVSTLMNPATLLCSISILKGLFLLNFYDIKYFNFFQSNELFFLAIVGFYLLIVSGTELISMFIELFFRTSQVKAKED